MKKDDFEAMREHNAYYPFSDRAEWELTKFLCDNLNQGQITQFLKLLWVVSEATQPLSFKNTKQLFTFMDTLLVTPRWRCMPIHTNGYTTTHPINLIWRDALEVVHNIFGNPIFANHMEYDPYEINDSGERKYGEWMSCEHVSEIQVNQLPISATIVPIILASNKTPVTQQTGTLKMHPTFLTINNIHSEICMKATLHTWACITYIPVPEYVVNSEFSGLLEAHVWHKCMDLVLQNLKVAAQVGKPMVDPMGCRCYVFTPLAAHIADLPEQLMIACISKNTTNPWKVREFQELAKQYCLSGDWRFADPSIFLVPELLHACHKFLFDHALKWCKEVIGASELNARFCSQHKRIGTCHFSDGVSHVNQMTGHEHHDIQRMLVPTIVGVTSPGFTCVISQAPTFTPSSLNSMVSSLNEFHSYKHFVLEAEAHTGTSGPINHFQIPKLESFNLFARSIQQLGTIIQHSVDVRISLINIMDNEFDEVIDMDPTFSWIAHVAPQEMHHFQVIHPVRNHFLKGILSSEANTAFHVTIAHDLADHSATALAQRYHLPDFPKVLSQYLDSVSGRNSLYHSYLLKSWFKFRLQLHSQLCPCNIMPSQQVQAYPPSDMYPFGNCGIVLLQPTNAHLQSVLCVAQLPVDLKDPLLYVQLFEIAAPPEAEPHIAMYQVRCSFYPMPDGSLSHTRIRKIVRLVDVTHAVELIPIYGTTMDRSVTSVTSLEHYNNFYLNAFSDKEWYHTLHADFI
ncbi:uncharacterized protein EDB91DRAFT_1237383 [Suillus paluster]|uniref:uncharacterized protein n=1 Tax=Suillus paluster TaxID=48578 RepID=UPI001B880C21|nr:uncharacterized protein EDB91DRAFT_1237383 [Suillus paluster]KAG1740221.1 hypothetical protein EDB91DRAFT_1237383 [Suillus paluster]